MKEKRISFSQGKGLLSHDNRLFMTSNVDPLRTPDNITFVCQPIAEAYDQLFGQATERYNAHQKRNDRNIHGSYYEYLFHCKPSNSILISADKRKSFYEDVMQIGKMEDSGVGTEDFQLVAECLKEYMTGFQERNPNFYVFNAVLHMDEQTLHLHIDYIPVGHYQRGQDTQNGIAQALKEMGYGDGKNAIARWRAAEVEVMNAICRAHGIEPLAPEKSRGTLEVAEYKEQRHKADQLAEENARVEAEIAEKKQERDQILRYLPDVEKTSRLEFKFDELCDELDGLIKNPLSATKNRKRIAELGEEMKKRLMASYKARDRSETTVYEVREENEKLGKDWKETRERNRKLSANNHKLYQEKSALQSQVDELTEFISLLERFDLRKYGEAKALQENIHRQREQQQEQPSKKKKWVLE